MKKHVKLLAGAQQHPQLQTLFLHGHPRLRLSAVKVLLHPLHELLELSECTLRSFSRFQKIVLEDVVAFFLHENNHVAEEVLDLSKPLITVDFIKAFFRCSSAFSLCFIFDLLVAVLIAATACFRSRHTLCIIFSNLCV